MLTTTYENGRKVHRDLMGNKYQYNLNDPSDRLAYQLDIDAQIRDRLSLNPTRNQNGGGIYE